MKLNFKKLIILTVITTALLGAVTISNAQTITSDTAFGGDTGETAETLAGTAGLGTSDPRLIASRVINVGLGFLGIIAVAIIIYAGFLWMTAQGNMEQIDRAKKILTGGVIGLVIILSAFGIAALVLRLLFGASGGISGGGDNPIVNDPNLGGTPIEFEINSTYPEQSWDDVIRNVVITYQFNMGVSDKDLEENFKVYYLIEINGGKEEVEVEGDRIVKGNVLEFIPNSVCEEPYADRKCFDKNTDIIVRAKSGILSLSKKSLACSSLNTGWPCKLEFNIGEKIDTEPPVITKFNTGRQACANNSNVVEIEAKDDTGIRLIYFYVDGDEVSVPNNSPLHDNPARLVFNWDGSGFNNGDKVNLKVVVHDADSNTAEDIKQLTISDDINCDNTSHVSPIIDWVNPKDGAPGNLVTIGGRYFGNFNRTKPENTNVYFTGDKADWVKADLAYQVNSECTGDWANNRIIAVVPEGAVDGPIKVEKINTEQERLSGISADFGIITTIRPGLCKVNPISQKVGENITLHGINLGASGSAEDVVFGYENENEIGFTSSKVGAWNKMKIENVKVPVIKTATTSIRVKQEKEYSNPIDFRAETSAHQPLITKVDPDVGHEGDYITIYGSNFGATRGIVKFGNQNADTNFPAECSIENIWRDTQIIVKVPSGVSGQVAVNVKTVGGLEANLSGGFREDDYCEKDKKECNNSGDCSGNDNECIKTAVAGLCKIDPLSGPEGTEVSLYGERFGSSGNVIFYDNKTVTVTADNWTTSGTGADTAKASVPADAQSGPVKVKNSNPLNFNVESCLNDNQQVILNFCGTDDRQPVCCTANTRNAGACVADFQACGVDPNSQYAQYYFEFSTAATGREEDKFTAPRVIEECDRQNNQCNDQATPSPSPWTPRWDRILDRPLACSNSVITARFDKKMDINSYGGNIKLFKCKEGNADDSAGENCNTAITNNKITKFDNKFNLEPSNLDINIWYQVILSKNITSHADEGGLPMDNDYIWYFKTRESAEACKLGCIGVDPLKKTSNKPNEYIPYIVNGDAEDNACIMIDVTNSDYDFSWNSNLINKAEIDVNEFDIPSGEYVKDNSSATALAKTIAETDPNIPVVITATETNRNKSGKGELTIRFPEFRVEEVWPTNQCRTTCTNADVGVKFSANIKQSSIDDNKVKIYKCDDEKCDGLTIVNDPAINLSRGTGRGNLNKLNFDLSGALFEKDTWYRAIVQGGTSGILSDLDKPISNRNYNDNNGALGYSYSWTFKTGFEYCEVDHVDVLPDPGIATIIGEEIDYEAIPRSVDDQCSEKGQILRGNYDWEWNSDDATIATVTNNNSPAEVATAIGEGAIQGVGKEAKQTTDIKAAVSDSANQSIINTKTGSGKFILQCGYDRDDDCRIYNNIQKIYELDNQNSGVGNNSCCYPRPRKILSQPTNNSKNICRNAMLDITFNQEMESKSLNDNIFVVFNNGSNACPGTSYLRLSDTGSRNIVKGTLRELYLSFTDWVNQQIVFKPFAWTVNRIAQIPVISNLLNSHVAWAVSSDDRWCVAPGRLSASNSKDKTKVSFAPSVLMKANTEHAILIKGDNNITDDLDVGVISKNGVSMNGQIIETYNQEFKGTVIKFKTLPINAPNQGICVVDHVLMDPPAHLFSTNQDDDRDNNDADWRSADDNDHRFEATAKSIDGQSITSMPDVYDWTWTWKADDTDALEFAPIGNVTDNPSQTKATVATSETTDTVLRATATFGKLPDPTLPATMEGASKINIFICDNPWPPYNSSGNWPYQSAFGNFEFFYCRDQGDDTTVDDLPVLDDVAIPAQGQNTCGNQEKCILKEILFTYKGKPGAPVGFNRIGDANEDGKIDIRDAQIITQYVATQDKFIINLAAADVNLDGSINQDDATFLGKYLGNYQETGTEFLWKNTDNSVVLAWNNMNDVDYYNIYQRTENTSYNRPIKIEYDKKDSFCYAVIDSLQNNIPYYFKISSVRVVDTTKGEQTEESPLSNEVVATPERTSPLIKPTNLTASLDGDNVSLTWDNSDDVDVTRYRIIRGNMVNSNFYDTEDTAILGNIDNYTWNLKGDSSSVFYFKVQALGSGDLESELSEFVMVERK